MIRCASFDIGKKNFAFCIEEINKNELLELNSSLIKIPKNKRYNTDGTMSEELKNIMNRVYLSGKLILHKNVNLTQNCDSKQRLDPETYHNMADVLDEHVSYWDTCSVFIIEEQMMFKGKINPMAAKLAQHCYSYFCFKYGRFREVIFFPSYNKTQILGAPKTQTKTKKGSVRWKTLDDKKRKEWSVNVATNILNLRNEDTFLFEMLKRKKQDDLADVITQLQSFKFLAFVQQEL